MLFVVFVNFALLFSFWCVLFAVLLLCVCFVGYWLDYSVVWFLLKCGWLQFVCCLIECIRCVFKCGFGWVLFCILSWWPLLVSFNSWLWVTVFRLLLICLYLLVADFKWLLFVLVIWFVVNLFVDYGWPVLVKIVYEMLGVYNSIADLLDSRLFGCVVVIASDCDLFEWMGLFLIVLGDLCSFEYRFCIFYFWFLLLLCSLFVMLLYVICVCNFVCFEVWYWCCSLVYCLCLIVVISILFVSLDV